MANDYATLTNAQALAANRAGQMTTEQRAQVERRLRGTGFFAMLLLLSFGGAVLAPTLFGSGLFSSSGVAVGSLICGSPLLLIGFGLVTLGIYAPVGIARQRRQMRQDLAAGTVARGEGWVAFTSRGYVARMEWVQPGTGAARWRHGRRVSLPPGRYHLYYLPESGILLSAEALGAQASAEEPVFAPPTAPRPDPLAGLPGYKPAPQPLGAAAGSALVPTTPLSPVASAALLAALAEAHHFTLADLELNRQGRLSAREAKRLSALPWVFIAFALVFWSCAGLVAFTTFSGRSLGIGVAVTLALGVVPAFAVLRALWHGADIREKRVVSVEGVVEGRTESSGDTMAYYYLVVDKKFQVSGGAYPALISGLRYRIFYTPRSKRLVSIEPL
jgi:hypothetical protein